MKPMSLLRSPLRTRSILTLSTLKWSPKSNLSPLSLCQIETKSPLGSPQLGGSCPLYKGFAPRLKITIHSSCNSNPNALSHSHKEWLSQSSLLDLWHLGHFDHLDSWMGFSCVYDLYLSSCMSNTLVGFIFIGPQNAYSRRKPTPKICLKLGALDLLLYQVWCTPNL